MISSVGPPGGPKAHPLRCGIAFRAAIPDNGLVSSTLQEPVTPNTVEPPGISKTTLWVGRIMSALPALFLILDGVMKLVKPEPVVEATVQLGYDESVIVGLGIIRPDDTKMPES